MALRFITGILGHGKSLYGARLIGRGLNSGRVIASNVRLQDGWQYLVLKHNPFYLAGGRKYRREAVREVSTRYFYEPDFARLLGARVKGSGEGRGIRLFDEAHNRLNSRDFKEHDQNLMLRRLSLGRKRGWEDYIISQHKQNVDKQIRRIAHSEIQVVDLQKLLTVPVIGMEIIPFHFFYVQEFKLEESSMGTEKRGRRIGFSFSHLGWWKDLYDTFEDFEFDDELDDTGIVLPLPAPPLTLEPGAYPILIQGNPPQVEARSSAAPTQLPKNPKDAA
jgi:hypothetical protein